MIVSEYRQLGDRAGGCLRDGIAKLIHVRDRRAVIGGDDVAVDEFAVGRRAGINIADQDAGLAVVSKRLGQRHIVRDVSDADAQPSTNDLGSALQIRIELVRPVGGNGESDAAEYAGLAGDRGVDADDFAVNVYQRSAAVAGIDRGVDLNEVLIRFAFQVHVVTVQG